MNLLVLVLLLTLKLCVINRNLHISLRLDLLKRKNCIRNNQFDSDFSSLEAKFFVYFENKFFFSLFCTWGIKIIKIPTIIITTTITKITISINIQIRKSKKKNFIKFE